MLLLFFPLMPCSVIACATDTHFVTRDSQWGGMPSTVHHAYFHTSWPATICFIYSLPRSTIQLLSLILSINHCRFSLTLNDCILFLIESTSRALSLSKHSSPQHSATNIQDTSSRSLPYAGSGVSFTRFSDMPTLTHYALDSCIC